MRAYHAAGGPGELLARTSFVEPLVAGRRVLELGGAAATAGASARALVDRGAASVVAADDDAEGLAAAAASSPHPAVEYLELRGGELPAGPFDLVLVHAGAPLAAAPEQVAALAARLAPGGHLVAALPVAGAPSLAALARPEPEGHAAGPAYESFVGSLEAVFPVVEIATQSATLGWTIARSSEAEPELTVDGTHGEAAEAAAYLAICGAAPSGLSGMVLATLPAAAALRDTAARAAADVDAVRDALAQSRADALGLAGRLEEAGARATALEEDLAALRARVAAEEERAARAERQVAELQARVGDREAALAAARNAEAERARERDEARRDWMARAKEARAWADAMVRLEQRIAELEALAAAQAREAEIAQGEAARAAADAAEARARAEEGRYEADAAVRRAAGAEAELRRLHEDLEAGRAEAERLRGELEAARGRAGETAQG
jgi:hypothetical protein